MTLKHRENAKKQTLTIVPSMPEPRPRKSWWTEYGREDFTAIAKVMVQPETRTNYRVPSWEP